MRNASKGPLDESFGQPAEGQGEQPILETTDTKGGGSAHTPVGTDLPQTQTTESETLLDGTVPVVPSEIAASRETIETTLASGGEVHPQDIAVSQGLVAEDDKAKLHTAGLTLPSVSMERGVSADGSVIDERHDEAMALREKILSGTMADDDEIHPGVTVARMRAASHGISVEGQDVDIRRVTLMDRVTEDAAKGGATGSSLFTQTTVAEHPKEGVSPTEVIKEEPKDKATEG